ncbi:MAG: class I SAM-dependent methyltransferase [Cyclobacteriaceae bacterium]|nr:class I SAM-dependent methyltransferase [Cyclobacteriaceae bacterium]
MSVYTTEIASDQIVSDNPIHQRLLKAYLVAKPFISGSLLEMGCGEGRGVTEIAPLAKQYTAIDKIETVIQKLKVRYPAYRFETGHFPPLPFPDNSFDTIVSFQVIEHIKNDRLFLNEIHRVLAPGGKALITTPNIRMTLSRNPWHIREYTADELITLGRQYFSHVEMKGIAGNEKVMEYHRRNKQSVEKITKFDFFNLQYRLPAPLLRLPYDLLNRLNRNKLQKEADQLVISITADDYVLAEKSEDNLDLFCILTK